MTDRYRNKYRASSIRLQNWDYGWNAAYFVTLCTHHRLHFFGEIADGKMRLSPVGILADVFWHEIKNHAQKVESGAFVVMPDHVHGVLILNGDDFDNVDRNMLLNMINKFGGGPVGLETLAATICEEADTIEDVYEPYLLQLGFINKTPRGRVVTKMAYDHLGIEFKV